MGYSVPEPRQDEVNVHMEWQSGLELPKPNQVEEESPMEEQSDKSSPSLSRSKERPYRTACQRMPKPEKGEESVHA